MNDYKEEKAAALAWLEKYGTPSKQVNQDGLTKVEQLDK